jgi:hypothetical protein
LGVIKKFLWPIWDQELLNRNWRSISFMQEFDKPMAATAEALREAFDGQRPAAKRKDLKPEI